MFNLVEGKKWRSKSEESIFISEEYLVCFGEDIMVYNNCLVKGGTSSWPSTFEGEKMGEGGGGGLCGVKSGGCFGVEEMEVYEIGSKELEMTMG